MKITKTFVVAFPLAFLIGLVSVPPTQKTAPKTIAVGATPEKVSAPPIKSASKPEVIEEVGSRIDEAKSPYKIKLVETGEGFHGEEIEAKNGEVWLGLFKERENYFLRSAKIKIRPVQDDIVDDQNAAKKTGKSVAVEGKLKPIFLLKNAKNLREGKITTLFQGLTWDDVLENEESELAPDQLLTTLGKDFVQTYKIGGREYALKVVEATNKNDEKILALVLQTGKIRQILQTMSVDADSSIGTLYWAGDLDGDEKPDFYFDLFEHYNVDNKVLFLSSEAEKGKLVKTVAQFWTTGC